MLAAHQRGLKVAHKRQPNFDFENERKAYDEKVLEMRRKHKDDYWHLQTQVENQYIERHKRERITKLAYDMDLWRTQICNISWMSVKKMDTLKAREDRLITIMKHQDIAENRRLMTNRYMLDAMQLESRRWPKMVDLDTKISAEFVLPQTILNYTDYQEKL